LDGNVAGTESYPVARTLADRGIPFVFGSGYSPDSCRGNGVTGRRCRSRFKAVAAGLQSERPLGLLENPRVGDPPAKKKRPTPSL
jgi:hypothetical protein